MAEAKALLDSTRAISDQDKHRRISTFFLKLANEKIHLKNQLLDSFRRERALQLKIQAMMKRRILAMQ